MTLTLDIDAETPEGFPEDVESVIRDNAASLRITDYGFEGCVRGMRARRHGELMVTILAGLATFERHRYRGARRP